MRSTLALLGITLASLAPAQDRHIHTDRPKTSRVLPLPKQDDCFFFAVFGDRTGGKPEGLKVLDQAIRDVNLLDPDMVLTVGDLIQGYNKSKLWMQQMKEFKGYMDKLSMPWFPVAGNHDLYGEVVDGLRRLQHAKRYEKHFGPLWYWFEHKNCAFVVLHTDETDPKTGEATFKKPAAQKMSPEQFAWLKKTLAANKQRDHVFVFLHHPRWHKGGYGNDWEKVHRELKKAGNVSAVFAGHIHKMVYGGKRDGIEYFALATTGGALSKVLPVRAGYVHHYNLVTVRKDKVSVTTIPVGTVIDPKTIDKQISDNVRFLNGRLTPRVRTAVGVARNGKVDGKYVFELFNPTDRPVEYDIIPECHDPRWRFEPDHRHAKIEPGQTLRRDFKVTRVAGRDLWFEPTVRVRADYLAKGLRISMQDKVVLMVLNDPYGQPKKQPKGQPKGKQPKSPLKKK